MVTGPLSSCMVDIRAGYRSYSHENKRCVRNSVVFAEIIASDSESQEESAQTTQGSLSKCVRTYSGLTMRILFIVQKPAGSQRDPFDEFRGSNSDGSECSEDWRDCAMESQGCLRNKDDSIVDVKTYENILFGRKYFRTISRIFGINSQIRKSDFRRCGNYLLLRDSNFWCVRGSITFNVTVCGLFCTHTVPFRTLLCP